MEMKPAREKYADSIVLLMKSYFWHVQRHHFYPKLTSRDTDCLRSSSFHSRLLGVPTAEIRTLSSFGPWRVQE
jgi:hypothetical protein